MKRAFLYSLGTFLIVGAIGSLASFDEEAVVLALSLIPVSVVAIAAANRAPPNRSLSRAILGWLLGSFALVAGGVAVISVLRLVAFLRRAGLIGTDFWTAISILWLGLLVFGCIVCWVKVRRPRFAHRTKRKTRREEDWRKREGHRQQEAKKRREWWEVLEVDPKAGPDEIRRAYLRKVQIYHPDKVAGLAFEFTELSESRTRELNLAFEQAKHATSYRA